jgi:CRP-like cAMP-binding protein
MSRLFIASVDRFGPLNVDARASLSACSTSVVNVAAGQAIIRPGEASRLRILVSGLAVRQAELADVGRQILGFATPGDLIDLSGLFTGADHEVRALGPCEMRQTTTRELRGLTRRHPSLQAALCRAVMTEAKLQRHWLVSLGRRSAASRTAHLFCEIYARQEIVGMASDGQCRFPVLQSDVADALGLSVVHTHRTLQDLKRSGLATLRDGALFIEDWDRLAALAKFDPECFRPEHDPAERTSLLGSGKLFPRP